MLDEWSGDPSGQGKNWIRRAVKIVPSLRIGLSLRPGGCEKNWAREKVIGTGRRLKKSNSLENTQGNH